MRETYSRDASSTLWYSHKLRENYDVFCNQFEVINIIFLENMTTCNMSAADVLLFIHNKRKWKRDSNQ